MKPFKLQLLTPEKTLYKGEVTSLSVNLIDGGMQVLAGHLPSIVAVAPGKCSFNLLDNTQKIFASSSGVLNIKKDGVIMLCELLEWEEDVIKVLEEREQIISKEHLRRIQSDREYRLGLVALQRAFAYLKDKKGNNFNK